MYKIFVSYSFHDQDTADRFWSLRRPPHVGVYVAQHSVPFGGQIPVEVTGAVQECDLFVLLWSRHSHDSEWVRHELGMAIGQDKQIIPVMLEPDCALPDPIRAYRYMPYHQNPDGWMGWFQQLANDIATKRGSAPQGGAWDLKSIGAGLLAGLGLAWIFSQDE